jgi:integrase/recombinase XerD
MASLYKKPILVTDPKTGKKVNGKSRKWWGRFKDETGKEKRVPLAADKPAAHAMLGELVKKVERRLAGIEDPFETHQKKQLSEHSDDFLAYLANKESSWVHIRKTKQRVRAIIEGCKFLRIGDISASRVQEFLGQLRAKGRSVASSNHYLRAIKIFTRWLVRDRRTSDDRLTHLSRMNAETDRRWIRRPLTTEEFVKLLDATEPGPAIQNVTGPDRAVLYLIGAYTGFRRNEIASIKPTSFNFDSSPETLTIEAAYSKHRRTDVIPLRGDFADRIRVWLASKPGLVHDQVLFDITKKRTAEMLKQDLERAGIPYVDEQGRVADFHSLRKTFITNLSKAGVSPKMAQTLARHSDINLTMNTYTTLGLIDQMAAVEALPAVPIIKALKESERTQATGTDGPPVQKPRSEKVPLVVPRGAQNGAIQLAPESSPIAPPCTERGNKTKKAAVGISTENTRVCTPLVQFASNCSSGRGGIRTHTPVTQEGILSPQCLPFHHAAENRSS